MSDARLRELERAGAAGGPREREALRAERDRLGLPRGFDDGPWLPAVPVVRSPCGLCLEAAVQGLRGVDVEVQEAEGVDLDAEPVEVPVSSVPCDSCHATMRCRWRCTHPLCVAPVLRAPRPFTVAEWADLYQPQPLPGNVREWIRRAYTTPVPWASVPVIPDPE